MLSKAAEHKRTGHLTLRTKLRLRLFKIADNLKKRGWSLGWVSAINSKGRTIWIADAHRDGQRFIVRADEMLTAFLELESAIRTGARGSLLG
jgi:hypothetical protein